MPCAIVDSRISCACQSTLLSLGFKIVKLREDKRLSVAVSAHPDMLIHKIGELLFVTSEYYSKNKATFDCIKELSPCTEIIITNDEYGSKYPQDVKFNLLKMGKKAFGRLDAISQEIKKHLLNLGYELINTNQGYPACTTLALNEGNAITADCGMARALKENGIEVLKINEGDINLPPHDFGFIGGAYGVYNKCVYFIGDIDTHRDAIKIKEFITEKGFTFLSLSNERLSDLGGIIFID